VVSANRAAVFLDRDGVLVVPEFRDGRSYAPTTLDDFHIYPDAPPALARLKAEGYTLVVVSNQPDVGKGIIATEVLAEMNRRLFASLPVDDIRMCTHRQDEACDCRKPKPGMLLAASKELGIDLDRSFMIGDRKSDIEAGKAAGCKTVFVDLDYTAEEKANDANWVVRSVSQAIDHIIKDKGRPMVRAEDLKVKLFADGADIAGIMEMYANPMIKGFTTNPTLMRKVGINNYEAFAKELLSKVRDRSVSLEVFADEFDEMERQAMKIASWGKNVAVKIPVTNTRGESAAPLIKKLADKGVVLNITAILTLDQVREVGDALAKDTPAIVSVFAGRIADTGVNPGPMMKESLKILAPKPKAELLWASPRELLNVIEADEIGCHIITATNDILKKVSMIGKDLTEFSRETVEMFRRDAVAAGYNID
jgi:transaldolase